MGAFESHSLWEALGEKPAMPRDASVVRICAAKEIALVPKEQKLAINSVIAAAVASSLAAWQACHAFATEELDRLHKALRAFGSSETVEPFLREHCTVHHKDREACQKRLDELLVDVKASEVPAIERLKRLYEEAGLGGDAFKAFVIMLDGEESKEARKKLLEKETKRVDKYIESITLILGPLRELKALVVAGVAFEANVQAGKSRFSGNSLHFLEEEKFRRRFGARYPELIDVLIEAIVTWERDSGMKFAYHGVNLREGLESIAGQTVGLVRVPGDLSSMDKVVTLLNLADPGSPSTWSPPKRKPKRANTVPVSPGSQRSAGSTPSNNSQASGAASAALRSRSTSDSPKLKRKPTRTKSLGSMARIPPDGPSPPSMLPIPSSHGSLPKLPRCPEGAMGGGNAPGVRQNARACRGTVTLDSSPCLSRGISAPVF